jgi:threonine efflux protein
MLTAGLFTVSLLHWGVLVTPGANLLLVSQLAASGQRRAALWACLGVCTVTGLWASLALAGLSVLFAALPALRLALQFVGAGYLGYIAWRLWRSGGGAQPGQVERLSTLAAYRRGFLTNITNPKTALFFGGVFAAALPPLSATVVASAITLVVANALGWHLFLALAFSRGAVQRGYASFSRGFNRGAALLVGALGLRVLLGTVRELKP